VVASHVLLAMGMPIERARSAIRFSLGKWTTAEEIDQTAHAIGRIVERLARAKTDVAAAVASSGALPVAP
jgi:cysteine desulfurase